mgnify:CR=1 FL=1
MLRAAKASVLVGDLDKAREYFDKVGVLMVIYLLFIADLARSKCGRLEICTSSLVSFFKRRGSRSTFFHWIKFESAYGSNTATVIELAYTVRTILSFSDG